MRCCGLCVDALPRLDYPNRWKEGVKLTSVDKPFRETSLRNVKACFPNHSLLLNTGQSGKVHAGPDSTHNETSAPQTVEGWVFFIRRTSLGVKSSNRRVELSGFRLQTSGLNARVSIWSNMSPIGHVLNTCPPVGGLIWGCGRTSRWQILEMMAVGLRCRKALEASSLALVYLGVNSFCLLLPLPHMRHCTVFFLLGWTEISKSWAKTNHFFLPVRYFWAWWCKSNKYIPFTNYVTTVRLQNSSRFHFFKKKKITVTF